MLDVRKLEVLRAVAAAGSFSAAADALSYTPSAVSQQIAALEREVGTPVVVRLPRGVRLTQAGHVLAQHAEAVAARLATAERDLRALAELAGGRLAAAVFHSAASRLLPRAAADFRRRHPGVTLELSEADPTDAVPRVRDGALDLALVFSYAGPVAVDEPLEVVPVAREPVLLALPAAHPAAREERVRLGRLAAEPWLQCTSPSCAALLVHAAQDAGFSPDVRFTSADYAAVLGFVAAGLGLALVPALAVSGVPPEVVLRPLAAPVLVRHVAVVLPPPAARAPAAEAFAAALKDAAYPLIEDLSTAAA